MPKKVNDRLKAEIVLGVGYQLDTEEFYLEIVTNLPLIAQGQTIDTIRVLTGKAFATYTRHTYIGLVEFWHYGADIITIRKLDQNRLEPRNVLIYTVLTNAGKLIYSANA